MPVFDQWASLLASLRRPQHASDREQLVLLALGLAGDVAAGAVGCSLTEIDGAGYRTPASSNRLAVLLDHAQYAASSGPCVSAVRDRQVQRVDVAAAEDRWPVFAATALEQGVRSSLSYPVAGTTRPTALNVYSSVDAAFGSDRSVAVAGLLARCIGELSPARHAPTRDDRYQARARHAQHRGQRVNEAVEHLMRRRALSRSEAFAELARRCQAGNTGIELTAQQELTEGEQMP